MRIPSRWAALCLGASLILTGPTARADTVSHNLSLGDFAQDWTNINLIVTDDDWSGVPSITGYLGDTNAGSTTGVDPQTYVSPGIGQIDVLANRTNPNLTNGGVAEFEITDPCVALQGSGTADTPAIVLFMNSLGRTAVTIGYNLRDIDASADDAVQPVALQYRIGGIGDFVNVPGAFVADASTGPGLASLVTPVSASLAVWDNQALLELRILTANAAGVDEWIGVDDIRVTSLVPEPGSVIALGAGVTGLLGLARRGRGSGSSLPG